MGQWLTKGTRPSAAAFDALQKRNETQNTFFRPVFLKRILLTPLTCKAITDITVPINQIEELERGCKISQWR